MSTINKEGGDSFSLWEGVFFSLEEIYNREDLVIGTEENYDSQYWIEKECKVLLSYREKSKTGVDKNYPPKNSSLPLFFSLINPGKILDYGGSNGWVFDFLKTTISETLFQKITGYSVYDFKKSCEFFSPLHSEPVNYLSEIESLEEVDLLYSNSTLQYILEEDEWTRVISKTNPKWILLDDFFCHDHDEDYFTLQKYRGRKMIVKFRSINKFKNYLEKIGYEVVCIFPFISGYKTKSDNNFLDMGEVPKEFRINYSQSILIRRLT